MKQIGLPFQGHSATSRDAAIAYADSAPNARQRVYDLLERMPGGLTDEEIQEALRMNPSTQRPRRIELERAGVVHDSGRTRRTRSGSHAVVWTVTGAPLPERWPKHSKRKQEATP